MILLFLARLIHGVWSAVGQISFMDRWTLPELMFPPQPIHVISWGVLYVQLTKEEKMKSSFQTAHVQVADGYSVAVLLKWP